MGRRKRTRVTSEPTQHDVFDCFIDDFPVQATGGQGPHLTKPKRPKLDKDGNVKEGESARARCRICRTHSTVVCSKCVEDGVDEAKSHYCKPGKTCFAEHLQMAHSDISDMGSLT